MGSDYEDYEGSESLRQEAELTEFPAETEILEEGVIREHLGERGESVAEQYEEIEGIEELEQGDRIAGNPEEDMENWHPQLEQNSCAIASQSFIAEQLLDGEYSEESMIRAAEKMGWYEAREGTAPDDVGKLLECLGLEVEREYNVTLSELAETLESGEKVICGVNNQILACPEMAELPGIKANHAVQVIGIDATDPEHVEVILNDPGVADGQGIRHDLDTFMEAWETSGYFAVTACKEAA